MSKWDVGVLATLIVGLALAVAGGAVAKGEGNVPHPGCLSLMIGAVAYDEPRDELNLEDCLKAMEEEPGRLETQNAGMLWVDPRGGAGGTSYVNAQSYGVLPDGSQILVYEVSDGGTGVFSGLISVTRDGAMLRRNWEDYFGDRCNGGLSNLIVDRRDGSIYASQHLTLFDLLQQEGKGWEETGDYDAILRRFGKVADSLPFCAVCCAGEAIWRLDATTGQRTFLAVNISVPTNEVGERADTLTRGQCIERAFDAVRGGVAPASVPAQWRSHSGLMLNEAALTRLNDALEACGRL